MPDSDQQVVEAYMDAYQELDVDKIMTYLSPDAVLEFPYALPVMAGRVEGVDNLRAHVAQLPAFMRSFTYSDVEIEPMAKAGRFLVQCRASGVLLNDSAPPYENRYAIIAEVAGGQVTYWREYFGAVEVGELLAGMAE